MKITADKITSQLSKGLSPVWFITGDQPLLVGEAIDAVRAGAREAGFDERVSHVADGRYNWDKVFDGLDNLSLFASRKIIEIQIATGKPGRDGSDAIVDLVADPPPDTLFIISSPKLDGAGKNSKWAKTLARDAVYVEVRSPGPGQLQGWLRGRLRAEGLECDAEGLELLAQRIEGNLLAAQQEISKLALLADHNQVTAETVQRSVADGSRFDVFQLADAAIGQDLPRAIRILYGLRNEGVAPELTLWALVRETNTLLVLWTRVEQGTPLGRAMQQARVWQKKEPLLSRALDSHDEGSIRRLVAKASQTDRIIKGASPGLPWNALLELVLLIARPQRPVLAGYEA